MPLDHDRPLTPEEEILKQRFADEDAGLIPIEPMEWASPYVPIPTAPGETVAVFVRKTPSPPSAGSLGL
ncbi:MAG: hypothetical protein ABL986_18995 [Vicinamibacterales bacterium]